MSWPLRAGQRAERRRALIAELTRHLGVAAAGQLPTAAGLAEARAGLALAEGAVDDAALARCTALLDALPDEAPACAEHGDLILNNLVVDAADQMTPIDRPAQAVRAIVGRDAAVALLDLMSVRADRKQLDLDAGLAELGKVSGAERVAAAELLATAFPDSSADHAQALLLVGVLRHCAAHGLVSGAPGFLEAVGAGRLAAALASLRPR